MTVSVYCLLDLVQQILLLDDRKEVTGVIDVTACGRGQYVSLRIFSLSPACLSDDACAAKGPVLSLAEFLGRLVELTLRSQYLSGG